MPSIMHILSSILDAILPRKERIVRIDRYALEDISVSPVEHEACGTQITTLMQYRDRAVEDLIRALKYDHSGHAAKIFAAILAEYLREETANIRAFSTKPVILVPVPLHAARFRERGFNQIEKVLDSLPQEFKDGTVSRIESQVLVRTRATVQQTRLSRIDRLKNVAGAFALSDHATIKNAYIILVDDVTTTGATLAEAAKPFEKAFLSLLSLAHA